jgi:hypothetical protein
MPVILQRFLWTPVTVKLDTGAVISTKLAYVSGSEDQTFWTAGMELLTYQDFQKLEVDQAVTVTVYDEDYSFIVDYRSVVREAPGTVRLEVQLISPSAVYAQPRASLISKTWSAPILAKDAALEIIPTLDWQIVNWLVPADKLSFTDADPLSIVTRIAEAAGGIVCAKKDGQLQVRYRFPSAVVDWPLLSPAMTLTDNAHNISSTEGFKKSSGYNRFYIGNEPPPTEENATGDFTLELDSREEGLNAGKNTFYPGDQPYLLLYKSPNVTPSTFTTSAGTLTAVGAVSWDETEQLTFENKNEVQLSKVADYLVSYKWYGNDLGTPELKEDFKTILVPTTGIGVLKTVYHVTAYAYQLTSPSSLGGDEFFSILTYAQGDATPVEITSTRFSIFAQRGGGDRTGPPIVDDLIVDLSVATVRGRNELDAAEEFKEVQLSTVFLQDAEPGQVIEVADAYQGATWRGKVTSVEHRAEGPRLSTMLSVLKK